MSTTASLEKPGTTDTEATVKVTEAKSKSVATKNPAPGTLIQIDPKKIKTFEGFNARDFAAQDNILHVNRLSDDIGQNGVLNPIIIRYEGSDAYLVDGESRLRATLKAIKDGFPVKTIPAMVEQGHVDEISRVVHLITRNSGKNLNALEQGVVYAKLKGYGKNNTEIAKLVGVTPQHIANTMMLHTAPVELKALVQNKQVSAAIVVEELREKKDPKKVYEDLSSAIAERAVANKPAKVSAKHLKAGKAKKAAANDDDMTLTGTQKLKLAITALQKISDAGRGQTGGSAHSVASRALKSIPDAERYLPADMK